MIEFVYGGVDFQLDTHKGVLIGDEKSLQYRHLVQVIGKPSKYQDDDIFDTYYGVPWGAFRTTQITNPYKNPEQFSLLLALSEIKNSWSFPAELYEYLPYWEDEDYPDNVLH